MVSRRTVLAGVAGGLGAVGVASYTRRTTEDSLSSERTHEFPDAMGVNAHVIPGESHRGENNFTYFLGSSSLGLDVDQPDEIYSRVYVQFDQGWHQPTARDTCKIYWAGGNLSAGDAGQGGTRPSGADGWSVRIYSRGPVEDGVRLGSYVYHLDQEGDFGDLWEWPDRGSVGRWNQIDSHVRLNSVSDGSANDDGVLRAWLNESLQLERTDVRWRTDEALGFDRLGPGSYWGGDKPAPQTNILYYDAFGFTEAVEEIADGDGRIDPASVADDSLHHTCHVHE